MTSPWPLEITLQKQTVLRVRYDDGVSVSLPAEVLRVESPSAEVQGHGPGQKVTVTGKTDVRILEVQPVGNYAVRLVFDDGHQTGIYTWGYLYKLGGRVFSLPQPLISR